MECQVQAPSLAYETPSLRQILTLSSFCMSLNVLHDVVDSLLHVGLLAQLVLGAVFGSPLANLLPEEVQKTVQALGYLGLLLLVFEGGMATRLDILSGPKMFLLAFVTGTIGILMPIALSMILLPFAFSFTFLESFVVSVSLSSTSLGTILAVITASGSSKDEGEKCSIPSGSTQHLPPGDTANGGSDHVQRLDAFLPVHSTEHMEPTQHTSGFVNTRVGTILIGAAMLADIVVLVLSSVIHSLGAVADANAPVSAWPIARPFITSFLLIGCTVLSVRFIAKPVISQGFGLQNRTCIMSKLRNLFRPLWPQIGMLLWLAILSAFVSISDEIDSTDLIGAFCAGAFLVYSYKARPEGAYLSWDPARAFSAVKLVMCEYRLLMSRNENTGGMPHKYL